MLRKKRKRANAAEEKIEKHKKLETPIDTHDDDDVGDDDDDKMNNVVVVVVNEKKETKTSRNPTKGSSSPLSKKKKDEYKRFVETNEDILKFDRSSRGIDLTVNTNEKVALWAKSYTFMMWIFLEDTTAHETNAIRGLTSFAKWPEGEGNYVHSLLKDGCPYFSHFGQGFTCDFPIVPYKWTHIAFVYDRKDHVMYIYVNSIQVAQQYPKVLFPPLRKNEIPWWHEPSFPCLVGACYFGKRNANYDFCGKIYGFQLFVGRAMDSKTIKLVQGMKPKKVRGDVSRATVSTDGGAEIKSPTDMKKNVSTPGGVGASASIGGNAASKSLTNLEGSKANSSKKSGDGGRNRTLSSLTSLTRTFVEYLRRVSSEGKEANLNSVAETLNVHKRRVYDITNVLEGIGLLTKKHMGAIEWKGFGVYTEPERERRANLVTEITKLERNESKLIGYIQYVESQIDRLKKENPDRWFVSAEDMDRLISSWPKDNRMLACHCPSGMYLDAAWKQRLMGRSTPKRQNGNASESNVMYEYHLEAESQDPKRPIDLYYLKDPK